MGSNQQPTLTKSADGRVTMNEHGCRTADVAIEILRWMVVEHNLLVDCYERLRTDDMWSDDLELTQTLRQAIWSAATP